MIKFWYTVSGNIRRGAVMTFLGVFSAALAHAAELHDKVADQSGALVPGATVTATCTGAKQAKAATDSVGYFVLRDLPAGVCTLIGSSKQLTTAAPIQVALHEGVQTLDIVLVVPMVTQQVTVSDEANQLSTEGAGNASGLVLTGKSLDALSDDPDNLRRIFRPSLAHQPAQMAVRSSSTDLAAASCPLKSQSARFASTRTLFHRSTTRSATGASIS